LQGTKFIYIFVLSKLNNMKSLKIIIIAISTLAAVSTFSFALGVHSSASKKSVETLSIVSNQPLYSNHVELPEVIIIAKK